MSHHSHDQNQSSVFDDGLRLMQQCPLCRHEYKEDAIVLLDEQEGTNLVHITCAECQNAVLAMIMVSPLGMSSVGIITDLSALDAAHVTTKEIFSQDDVLDFYGTLQQQGILENALATARAKSNL